MKHLIGAALFKAEKVFKWLFETETKIAFYLVPCIVAAFLNVVGGSILAAQKEIPWHVWRLVFAGCIAWGIFYPFIAYWLIHFCSECRQVAIDHRKKDDELKEILSDPAFDPLKKMFAMRDNRSHD